MSPLALKIAAALALATGLAVVPAAPADQPQGQFQPTANDRDGDGIADASDCAPDDPTRPARNGADADCDGIVDAPTYTADSSVAVPMKALHAAARRAARVPVAAIPGADLGPAVLFGPRDPQPLLVFAAQDAMRVTVRPTLVFADGRRVKVPKSWSAVERGGAWALRLHPSGAQRVALAITVVDAAGASYRATRDLP